MASLSGRAPGRSRHASGGHDCARTHTDWLASVEDGYACLSGAARRIVLAGLSMGGVLALTMAARLPTAGVIAMATPTACPRLALRSHRRYRANQPYLPKSNEPPDAGWFDKEAWRRPRLVPAQPGALDWRIPETASRPCAPPCPPSPHRRCSSTPAMTTICRSAAEASMNFIYDHLGSQRKEKLLLSGSGHVLTRDAQRETVFRAAAQFVHSL